MAEELHETTVIICEKHLLSVTFNDQNLRRQVLEIFAQQIEDFRRELVLAREPEVLRGLLHRFKGSARGVGAFALGEALECAEALAAQGDLPELAVVEEHVTQVCSGITQLLKA